MPLRNALHKLGAALHHDSHHEKSSASHKEKTSTTEYHESSDRAFVEPSTYHQETFVQSSTEPDLISGSTKFTSNTISVNTADSKSTVFVDTTATATEMLDTTYQTLAPVQDTTVVHETFIREKVEEVQPVIHRQVVEPEIHRVIAPVMEHDKKKVLISEKNLGEIVKETYVEAPSAEIVASLDSALDVSTVDVKSSATTVELKPIVIEHHVKQVIEEIQPVIHRTIEEPELVRERVDIYETVVKAPVVYNEQRQAVFRETTTSSISGQSFTSEKASWEEKQFSKSSADSTFYTSSVGTTIAPKTSF